MTAQKMKYIIELRMVFSPDEKNLKVQDKDESVLELSNQATRLLLELIKHNKETALRNELIARVWFDYGFTGSNNSLNVAISELRKAFETFGHDPQLITTIPKVGFIFNARVEAILKEAPVLEENIPETLPITEMPITDNEPGKDAPPPILAVSAIIACLAFIVSFLYVLTQNKDPVIYTETPALLYNYKKCNVYYLGVNPPHVKNTIIDQAKAELRNEPLDCETTRYDILYSKDNVSTFVSPVSFIGICQVADDSNYNNCKSIRSVQGTIK